MTKRLKSIFSSDFQMSEEQVSIRGVMTHAPVCRSASCLWEEQLSVCSFQAVSLVRDRLGGGLSAMESCGSPRNLCFSPGCAAVALASSLVPMPSTGTTPGGAWCQVDPSAGPVWEGAQHTRGLFRTCWAWWPPQLTRSAFAGRQLSQSAQLVRGII